MILPYTNADFNCFVEKSRFFPQSFFAGKNGFPQSVMLLYSSGAKVLCNCRTLPQIVVHDKRRKILCGYAVHIVSEFFCNAGSAEHMEAGCDERDPRIAFGCRTAAVEQPVDNIK